DTNFPDQNSIGMLFEFDSHWEEDLSYYGVNIPNGPFNMDGHASGEIGISMDHFPDTNARIYNNDGDFMGTPSRPVNNGLPPSFIRSNYPTDTNSTSVNSTNAHQQED